ncbi:metallopeptidase TldD-related protein [Acanthopleuribacter pedis]|uniref:Metalloprotease TldD/E C-terminal domain-containing protein n=1 Tax=Acanthopleuribacter pedis TaxID=442870 RepID=A0A8J7U269_9BACT|nr:metallopeptidase TldD-related protein [Acanthopleuribacter pedis]MBO1318963.1 hypothetical protein [Acanthopleuribacter pedis]
MSLDRAHVMSEQQCSLVLTGTPSQPQWTMTRRAGDACYRVQGRRRLQDAVSRGVAAGLVHQAERWLSRLLVQLRALSSPATEVHARVLLRRRQVAGVTDYRQQFQGFWGRLKHGGSWDTAFGSSRQGQAVFRRGPWEDWPRVLPAVKALEPALPLIFSPYCGTMLHEALGHTLEAEYLAGSPLADVIGSLVSHHDLTAMDRPDLGEMAGSMSHDDTGRPATATTLVHRGILVGNLAAENGVQRRASYRDFPLIRASNFVVKAGTGDPLDWLQGIPRAYYVCWVQSGNWLPDSDRVKLLFGPTFYMEYGQPRGYINWTSMTFSVKDLLARIVGVGSDFTVDPVVHWCVKRNQSVPMSLATPSLLLRGYR